MWTDFDKSFGCVEHVTITGRLEYGGDPDRGVATGISKRNFCHLGAVLQILLTRLKKLLTNYREIF